MYGDRYPSDARPAGVRGQPGYSVGPTGHPGIALDGQVLTNLFDFARERSTPGD